MTEIIPESKFVFEIFSGIINDNQDQSLHDKKRETNWFTTHLWEQGEDVRYIQKILGHKSSKTTEIYTHITSTGMNKFKSPLDSIDWED